jgi:outer membrane protein TolC
MNGSPSGLGLWPTATPGQDRFGVIDGSASGGVVLTWTPFDMFVTRDRVASAELSVAAAQTDLDDLGRKLQGDRDQAVARESQARLRVELLSGGEETAAEAVRLARVRYETGNTILTELLDAELDGIAVESRGVQAALDLAVAHIDRLRAEGCPL